MRRNRAATATPRGGEPSTIIAILPKFVNRANVNISLFTEPAGAGLNVLTRLNGVIPVAKGSEFPHCVCRTINL